MTKRIKLEGVVCVKDEFATTTFIKEEVKRELLGGEESKKELIVLMRDEVALFFWTSFRAQLKMNHNTGHDAKGTFCFPSRLFIFLFGDLKKAILSVEDLQNQHIDPKYYQLTFERGSIGICGQITFTFLEKTQQVKFVATWCAIDPKDKEMRRKLV